MTDRHRILLADEDILFRTALRIALETEKDFEVVRETSDGDLTLEAVAATQPDLVIIDSDIPGLDAISVCRQLADTSDSRTLLLTSSADSELLLAALEAGAVGYVTRDRRLSDLVGSARAAARGEACVPRQMLGGLLQQLIRRRREVDDVQARFGRLSGREREVLERLAEGFDHEGIARALVISPQTARTHIQNVMTKLEVHSRIEAARLAVTHKFTAQPASR